MRSDLALKGARQTVHKGAPSVACLVFVLLLGIACWTGAMLLGRVLIRAAHLG